MVFLFHTCAALTVLKGAEQRTCWWVSSHLRRQTLLFLFKFKICKPGEVHSCRHGGVVYAEMGRANRDMAGIANWLRDS